MFRGSEYQHIQSLQYDNNINALAIRRDYGHRQSIAASSLYSDERESIPSELYQPKTLLLNGADHDRIDLVHALGQDNVSRGQPEWERYAGELQDISTIFDVTPLPPTSQPSDSQAGDDLHRLLELYRDESRSSSTAPPSRHSSSPVSEATSSYAEERLMLTYPSQETTSGGENPIQEQERDQQNHANSTDMKNFGSNQLREVVRNEPLVHESYKEQNSVEPSILSSGFYSDEDGEFQVII